MVRGKCALGRGLGPSPQESVIVPLSEHIYSSVSTGRQELSECHYFKLQLGNPLGGEAGVFGGEASSPPPSRLNPDKFVYHNYNGSIIKSHKYYYIHYSYAMLVYTQVFSSPVTL